MGFRVLGFRVKGSNPKHKNLDPSSPAYLDGNRNPILVVFIPYNPRNIFSVVVGCFYPEAPSKALPGLSNVVTFLSLVWLVFRKSY